MNKEDKTLLEHNGWAVRCESPFEIEKMEKGHQLGFASGWAAEYVLVYLKTNSIKPFSSEWWKDVSDEAWRERKIDTYRYCHQRIELALSNERKW